jgi:predicted CXXCH cytochrome family protein
MKKHILLLFVILGILVVSSTMVMAGADPGTGIKSTSHDLSTATGKGGLWNAGVAADPTLDRICIYCHAPHHTIKASDAALALPAALTYFPLWNHNLTALTYTMYTDNNSDVPNNISHKLNADLSAQPGSISKLCLSCHDGSVAVSSYGNFNGGISSSKHTGTANASGRILIGAGGDLSNHHPIGFDYGTVAAIDDEIRDAGNTLLGDNPYGLTIDDLLYGGKMECASCHDVHNTKNTGTKFTWVADENSNLCLSCHAK